MESHGRSFPDTIWTFQVKKLMGCGGVWWPVGLQCQPQSLSSGLWTLGLGLGLGLDNKLSI